MKTKRFSVLQLILAVLLTAVVLTGGGLLALRPAFSHRLSFRMARISLFCKRCFMYSSTRTWGVPSRS